MQKVEWERKEERKVFLSDNLLPFNGVISILGCCDFSDIYLKLLSMPTFRDVRCIQQNLCCLLRLALFLHSYHDNRTTKVNSKSSCASKYYPHYIYIYATHTHTNAENKTHFEYGVQRKVLFKTIENPNVHHYHHHDPSNWCLITRAHVHMWWLADRMLWWMSERNSEKNPWW